MGSMAGARTCQRGAGCMGGAPVMAGMWHGLVCERDMGGARGMSVRGVSVRGMSVRGVSVRGMSVRGVSVRGMSVRGVSVRGMLVRSVMHWRGL